MNLTFSGNVLLKPVIESAGKDITNWFDKKSKDVSIRLVSKIKNVHMLHGCSKKGWNWGLREHV